MVRFVWVKGTYFKDPSDLYDEVSMWLLWLSLRKSFDFDATAQASSTSQESRHIRPGQHQFKESLAWLVTSKGESLPSSWKQRPHAMRCETGSVPLGMSLRRPYTGIFVSMR